MSDQVKIAIFGAGAIGSAVYDLLRDRTTYSVTVADMRDYKDLHPKAIENKKTECVLQKSLSEILVLVKYG